MKDSIKYSYSGEELRYFTRGPYVLTLLKRYEFEAIHFMVSFRIHGLTAAISPPESHALAHTRWVRTARALIYYPDMSPRAALDRVYTSLHT